MIQATVISILFLCLLLGAVLSISVEPWWLRPLLCAAIGTPTAVLVIYAMESLR